MKRLARIFRDATTMLSLVLCIATCMLWVRGHSVGDTYILRHTRGVPPWTVLFVQAWSSGGGVRIMIGNFRQSQMLPSAFANMPDPLFDHGSYVPGPKPYPINRFEGEAWTHGGFELFRRNYAIPTYSEWQRSATMPSWFLASALAVLPLAAARRIWRTTTRRLRRAGGLCAVCGYDLRVTPERCPECGTIPPWGASEVRQVGKCP